MFQQKARILWNEAVATAVFRIGLSCPIGFVRAKPGQFVMLRICDGVDPLLRRPFSIHKPIEQGDRIIGIEILYKVVGKGTRALAGRTRGEILDVLGPLGSAFRLPPGSKKIFIVAGGIGVAPMVYLARYLMDNGIRAEDCRVFLGGRTHEDLLCRDDFAAAGLAVHTTTDDGSAGDQCFVTHPMEMALAASRPDIVFACGPLEMLGCIIGIIDAHQVACQVSIESMMACGMGACLGCAVPAKERPDTYYHACLDGPVFDAGSIRFDPPTV
jgi:dihydroorotate dehydrogenase electron transfer subunit